MVALAESADRGPVSLRTLAKERKLPYGFLTQIVIPLRRAGLVRAKEGVRGGYTLAKPASSITLANILSVLEGDVKLLRCGKHENELCPSAGFCILPSVWGSVSMKLTKTLETIRLSDLLRTTRKTKHAATS